MKRPNFIYNKVLMTLIRLVRALTNETKTLIAFSTDNAFLYTSWLYRVLWGLTISLVNGNIKYQTLKNNF